MTAAGDSDPHKAPGALRRAGAAVAAAYKRWAPVAAQRASLAARRASIAAGDALRAVAGSPRIRRAAQRLSRGARALAENPRETARRTWGRVMGRAMSRGSGVPSSSLLTRIITLNLVGLAVLVAGVLYLNQFSDGLVRVKSDALKTQAELIAVVIADAAGDATGRRYERLAANEKLRRIALPTGLRAQLYDRSGRLTGDTRSLLAGQIAVEIETMPPPAGREGRFSAFLTEMRALAWRLEEALFGRRELYREASSASISRDPEVYEALRGAWGSAVRINSERELILSVAVPVRPVQGVIGAVVVSTEGGDIARIVTQARQAILQVFGVALFAALFLSLAFAYTIARPIRKLAAAAEATGARTGRARGAFRAQIPDFTDRGDEIGELSGALRGMTDALYKRMAAIESFAADVSHEIKNPLTSLRSAVESLRFAKTPEQQEALLRVIEHDVRRMDRLVTDISNASRLDAELAREDGERFDLAGLLWSVANSAAAVAENRGVTVRFEPAQSGGAPVDGLPERLARVFQNVIDNAVSFSAVGQTVSVRLKSEDPAAPGFRRVEVVDEGPGVPEENLESIFERFYSERPDSDCFGAHSGLGLSICRQIVEAHGGRIWAENRTDRSGARFVVLLPR